MLNDVVALLAQKAAEKGIELLLDCSEGLPAYLSGDPTHLRQVLVNLLNNAVKFTPQGSVTLKVEEHANGAPEKTKLHFTVRDTGIGIAAEQLGNIFSGYMQASAKAPPELWRYKF